MLKWSKRYWRYGDDKSALDYCVFYNIRNSKKKELRICKVSQLNTRLSSLDYNIIASWLELCDVYHTQACQQQQDDISSHLDIYLIEIETRAIILVAANTRYVALSYVWGAGFTGDGDKNVSATRLLPGFLPQEVPRNVIT